MSGDLFLSVAPLSEPYRNGIVVLVPKEHHHHHHVAACPSVEEEEQKLSRVYQVELNRTFIPFYLLLTTSPITSFDEAFSFVIFIVDCLVNSD